MNVNELKVGMRYHFCHDRKFNLSMFHKNEMFTINDINYEDTRVESISSDGGFLNRCDLDKIIVYVDGIYELVDVPLNPLQAIWNKQKDFNRNFFIDKNLTHEQRQQATKDFILHLTREALEVLDEVNWKMHKKKDKIVDHKQLLMECVDTFKYLLCIMQLWGFDSSDFEAAFWAKTKIVEERYAKEFRKSDA